MELELFDPKMLYGNQSFRCLVIGKSGSGKSVFTEKAYKLLKRHYTGLFVFSTDLNVGFYSKFDKPEKIVMRDKEEVIVPVLQRLESDQLENNVLDYRKDGTPKFLHRFCVIIDDVINHKLINSDEFTTIWNTFRKCSIDTFFLAHNPAHTISVNMKGNASHIVIFNMGGSQSSILYAIQVIADVLQPFENESRKDHLARARKMYHYYCVERKHGAIVIDLDESRMYYY